MKKILLTIFLLVILAPSTALAGSSFFSGEENPLKGFFQSTFYANDQSDQSIFGDRGTVDSLPAAVGRIIRQILGFVSVIMIIIVIWAGYLWVTAGGNDDQVKTAKTYIRNAVIGLVITLSAFVITSYVTAELARRLIAPEPIEELPDPSPIMDIPPRQDNTAPILPGQPGFGVG